MKLARVEVRNYRSIFEQDSTSRGLQLDIASGLNVLVGRNNCGKSNLFRAISAALDPSYEFDPTCDIPGPIPHRYPSIQVWFDCNPDDPEERALLHSLREYEQHARESNATRADRGQLAFRVSFAPVEDSGFERRERFVFLDGGDEPNATKATTAMAMLPDAIEQFRSLVRFVMVKSGESIASVLEGNFREILHSVVQEHMEEEFSKAEQHRSEYIKGLQTELLGPLKEIVTESVQRLFPEITDIHFEPDVSDIESTLSRVRIGLEDAVVTNLAEKGTGVRGGVLVAMLQYLAENTNRCVVMAIEEPESFLHPAAQEDLREGLETLATRDDVSVLVTTHSPFIVSQAADSMSFYLDKDTMGRTKISASSQGGDQRVAVISGIVREESLEDVLAAGQPVSQHAQGILMVEGYGDKVYLELAVDKLDRLDLLADIEIIPTGGTTKMLYKSLVASAASGLPVAVLHDADEPGLKVRAELERLKNPESNKPLFARRRIISYASAMPKDIRGRHAWEAEDLFEARLVEAFVEKNGGLTSSIVLGHQKTEIGLHVDMDHVGKISFGQYLEEEALPEDCHRWLTLITDIRKALDLPEVAEVFDEPAKTSDDGQDSSSDQARDTPIPATVVPEQEIEDERVLIVSKEYGHADYMTKSVFDGDPGRGLSPSIKYVGFYENGEIREEIPAVLARHDDLVFTYDLADRFEGSTNENDVKLGVFIREQLDTGRQAAGETRQILLLSDPDDDRTLKLDRRIKNTKLSPKGRPMAWVVRHKLTWKSALLSGATSTDELDDYEEDKA